MKINNPAIIGVAGDWKFIFQEKQIKKHTFAFPVIIKRLMFV